MKPSPSLVLAVGLALAGPGPMPAETAQPPNILLSHADDLGWSAWAATEPPIIPPWRSTRWPAKGCVSPRPTPVPPSARPPAPR